MKQLISILRQIKTFFISIVTPHADEWKNFPETLAQEMSIISLYTVFETEKVVDYVKIALDEPDENNKKVRDLCMKIVITATQNPNSLYDVMISLVHEV